MGKLTKEEFIKRAIKVHGNKYDYSKVDLDNRDEKGRICIICPKHGEFWQTPSAHLTGRKCNKCARPSYDTKSFIECAKKVHGEKYDYSKVKYINTRTEVIIICPEHGEFKVTPNRHLDGVGCKKCAKKYEGKNGSYTTEEFIKKAKELYGDEYDYSKTDLNNKDEKGKIIVTCKEIAIDGEEYGDFKVKPQLFLTKKFHHKIYNTELFIRLANFVHCNKYDYSKTDLEHKKNGKVTIICREHGEFQQHPSSHLNGQGCILCKNKKEGLLYRHLLRKYPNLNIETQKKFDWLGKQSLDFYLPDYNIAIEYQGRGHFEPVTKFDGENGFELQKKRDKIKKDLCEKNGIKLLYFTFDTTKTIFLGEKIYHTINEFDFLK